MSGWHGEGCIIGDKSAESIFDKGDSEGVAVSEGEIGVSSSQVSMLLFIFVGPKVV